MVPYDREDAPEMSRHCPINLVDLVEGFTEGRGDRDCV